MDIGNDKATVIRGLTARLLLVGGLAFLLCAGTFAVVLSLVREAQDASESLQVANERSTAVNRVLGLVVDMETSLRGYIVTRDEAFLGPYRRGIAELPAAERDLIATTAGDPGQARAARELTAAGARYRRWQIEQLDRARRDPAAAAEVIATGAGKRQVDEMRGLAAGSSTDSGRPRAASGSSSTAPPRARSRSRSSACSRSRCCSPSSSTRAPGASRARCSGSPTPRAACKRATC